MGNLLVLGNWEDGQPRNYYARTIKQPKLTNIPVYPSRRKRKGGSKQRGSVTRKNTLNKKKRSRRN